MGRRWPEGWARPIGHVRMLTLLSCGPVPVYSMRLAAYNSMYTTPHHPLKKCSYFSVW